MRRIVVVYSRPSLPKQRQRRMPIGRGQRAAPIPRAAFEAGLRRWYEPTDEARIGDDSSSGGTLWVWIQQGGRRFHLNANTTQEGVGEYLAMLTREPELKWAVVRGRVDRLMKVVFGRRQQVIPGFYLYAKASPAESDTYAHGEADSTVQRSLSPGPACPTRARTQTGRRAGVAAGREDDRRPIRGRCGAWPRGHGSGVPGPRRATGAGCGREGDPRAECGS